MTSLSTEHTLIAAIPILVVLAVLSAAIIVFPKTNLDPSSRANWNSNPTTVETQPGLAQPITLPTTTEPLSHHNLNPGEPFLFPFTSE